MKKKMLMMAALLCCLMGFTACGSDDEPDEPTTVTVTYTITLNADVHKVVDNVIVKYIDGSGNVKTAVVEQGKTTWTKSVTASSFPVRMGYALNLSESALEESELTQDTYNLIVDGDISYKLSTAVRENGNNKTLMSKENVKKSDVASVLKKNSPISYGYVLKEDGTLGAYELSW